MKKAAEIVEDARNGKDGGAILEMLEQLEQQIIELGAIKQAARDFICFSITTSPSLRIMYTQTTKGSAMFDVIEREYLAFQHLKELVLD